MAFSLDEIAENFRTKWHMAWDGQYGEPDDAPSERYVAELEADLATALEEAFSLGYDEGHAVARDQYRE